MLAAIRILFLLGFRRVYLLGVDFEMSPERRYQFDEKRSPGAISGNNSTYTKMIRWFSELQQYFVKEDFIIKNCNRDSKLKVFPNIAYAEALDEALSIRGNFSNERTTGMYDTLDRKAGAPASSPSSEH